MLENKYIIKISETLSLPVNKINATINLLQNDCTIPFIARYRKEKTGNLDEVQISKIANQYEQFKVLEKRKKSILGSLSEQNKLNQNLEQKISQSYSLNEIEDIYLPFKPKRKTKASIAKEKGFGLLAELILEASKHSDYLNEYNEKSKQYKSEEIHQYVNDILAETFSENASIRKKLRYHFVKNSLIYTKVIKKKEQEALKYKDYFDFSERITECASHRFMAIMRGCKEGFLRLNIEPDFDQSILIMKKELNQGGNREKVIINNAIEDSYKRLLKTSLEKETIGSYKGNHDTTAIEVFSQNLKELLLQAPLGEKSIIAIDPGIRTGCKVVVLNEYGDFLKNTTIFPFQNDKGKEESIQILQKLIDEFKIKVIAVGNGTGGREMETVIKGSHISIPATFVDESGASIYSASDVAREEFPNLDLTVRGAISIGRRLQDPLSELVKLDPKSIGVGQYQHDVDQKQLSDKLDETVLHCVNSVGVELNKASEQLLSYVSGIGKGLAINIKKHIRENGPFKNRKALLKVPKLGKKAFEQAAGFLRIPESDHPLDNTAIHPEMYSVVEKIAKDQSVSVGEFIKMPKAFNFELSNYTTESFGAESLKEVLLELEKPTRDPRDVFELFEYSDGVNTVEDLKADMTVNGVITNITKFGAFVDIGVHQDGLIHISQLSNTFVKDPTDVVKLKQKVKVKVLEVDVQRKRISLSLKNLN